MQQKGKNESKIENVRIITSVIVHMKIQQMCIG